MVTTLTGVAMKASGAMQAIVTLSRHVVTISRDRSINVAAAVALPAWYPFGGVAIVTVLT